MVVKSSMRGLADTIYLVIILTVGLGGAAVVLYSFGTTREAGAAWSIALGILLVTSLIGVLLAHRAKVSLEISEIHLGFRRLLSSRVLVWEDLAEASLCEIDEVELQAGYVEENTVARRVLGKGLRLIIVMTFDLWFSRASDDVLVLRCRTKDGRQLRRILLPPIYYLDNVSAVADLAKALEGAGVELEMGDSVRKQLEARSVS